MQKQVLGCAKDDRKKSKSKSKNKNKNKSRSSAAPRMTDRKARAKQEQKQKQVLGCATAGRIYGNIFCGPQGTRWMTSPGWSIWNM
jgi:hypothetical protein